MSKLSLSQLSVAEKDALIERLLVQIEALRLRIAELEGCGVTTALNAVRALLAPPHSAPLQPTT